MGSYIAYFLFRFFTWLIGILPFGLLYKLSDGVSWLLYRVVGYRRAVLEGNLMRSFPEKTPAEIKALEREVYRNLCDLMVESFKFSSLSADELIRRFRLTNPEFGDGFYHEGKSVILAGSHSANWEWGVSSSNQVEIPLIGLYTPITNPHINAYMEYTRGKHNTTMVRTSDTAVSFEKRVGKPSCHIFLGDQTPANAERAYWLYFFNQPTACLWGLEKYAKQYNYPVLYFETVRRARGFYEITMQLLVADPVSLPEGEITALYMRKVEQTIRKYPSAWLWTHRRWKHKPPAQARWVVAQ